MDLNKIKKELVSGLALMLAVAGLNASAQVLHPVKWSYAAKVVGKGEAVVFLKAEIEDGWHIYSTRQKDGGPVKTSFIFKPLAGYALLGKVFEPAPVTKYEPSFAMNVHYFERSVIFQQRVRFKVAQAMVKGQLEFMVCNDHQCLPPEDVDFSIPVK